MQGITKKRGCRIRKYPSRNTDACQKVRMDWKAYLCKDSLVIQNPWMSELHRPLKQVKNGYLIAFQLVFLYSGQEVCLLAKGRVSPSVSHKQFDKDRKDDAGESLAKLI